MEYTLLKPDCHSFWGFKRVQGEILSEEASTLQIWSVAFPTGQNTVYNLILVTDYLTQMVIKTVPHPPYSPYLTPCDFWIFPKLRGCRYETIKEMKEAVTKVIDTLTQDDFHGAFQMLLELYNKCIAAEGYYFEWGLEFHVCTINKSAHTKKSGNFSDAARIYIYIYIYIVHSYHWFTWWVNGGPSFALLLNRVLNINDRIVLFVRKHTHTHTHTYIYIYIYTPLPP